MGGCGMKKGIKDEELPLELAPVAEKRRRIRRFSQYSFFFAALFSFLACLSFFRSIGQINYFFLVMGVLFVCLGLSVKLFKDNKMMMVMVGALSIILGIVMIFCALLYL